jgi:hypothetical protein
MAWIDWSAALAWANRLHSGESGAMDRRRGVGKRGDVKIAQAG